MTPIDLAGTPLAPTIPAPSAALPSLQEVPLAIPAPVIDHLPAPTVRSNPGPWDKCDQETQRILKLDTFDGARFELQKGMGASFATSHAVFLGSSMHPGGKYYQFGSTLILGDALLVGRVDHAGVLNAQWHQQYAQAPGVPSRWGHHIQASLMPPFSQEESHFQADFDYKGDDFTGGVKLGSGPLVGLSYFQAVTPRVAMGGEGYVHLGRRMSHVTARARPWPRPPPWAPCPPPSCGA
jgi:mitochondrial import receptor subunit TOM40